MGRRCANDSLPPNLRHEHVWLLGGKAKATERYPPRLVVAVLRALAARLRKDRGTPLMALEVGVGPHIDEDDGGEQATAAFPPQQAATATPEGEGVIAYEYAGLQLDPKAVQLARAEEIAFMKKLCVWEPRTVEELSLIHI